MGTHVCHQGGNCVNPGRLQTWDSHGGSVSAFSADNKDVSVMMSEMDVNAIAGTLKLYFRELPEPLFTDEFYPNFAEGIGEHRWPRPCGRQASHSLVHSLAPLGEGIRLFLTTLFPHSSLT